MYGAGMRRTATWLLALTLMTLSLSGCASAKDRYRAEEVTCVEAYSTRAEIDACRAGVRARAGLPPRGGASDASAAGGAP